MSVIWSGITEEGAVVPVQVTEEGKVVAVGDGPQGDYLPITGGNLTGDLTIDNKIALRSDGSANFPGRVDGATFIVGENPNSGSGTGSRLDDGKVLASRPSGACLAIYTTGNNTAKAAVNADGSASFAGDVILSRKKVGSINDATLSFDASGDNYAVRFGGSGLSIIDVKSSTPNYLGLRNESDQQVITVFEDGAAQFARNQSGFTSDGELVFSSRGTRYKLFVSQGVCQAEPFTREMELKEKAEQFIADKRETKPSEPSEPQDEVTSDNDNA